MALTLRAVRDELDRLMDADENRTIDEIGREEIVQSVARAALLGARGNSGVILSQLIRGAAEELVSRPGQLIDATLIGAALAKAADRAYSSVRDPAEGTILTVAREMAHKIVTDVAHSPRTRGSARDRAERAGPRDRGRPGARRARGRGVGQARARAARGAARRGRGRRGRLRADDHHRGRGRRAARRRRAARSSTTRRRASRTPSTAPPPTASARTSPSPAAGCSAGRFVDAARAARRLGARGRRREHAEGAPAHRRRPSSRRRCSRARARSRAWTSPTCASRSPSATSASASLRPSGAQRLAPARATRPTRAAAPSRWSAARGCASSSASSACTRSTAAPTLNPSTYDLLAGIHEVPRRGGGRAAEQRKRRHGRRARRAALGQGRVGGARTTSQQAGLAAAVALAADRSVEENARAMNEALARVRTGAVAPAARDDAQGRFRRGEAVGFVGRGRARVGRAARDARRRCSARSRRPTATARSRS